MSCNFNFCSNIQCLWLWRLTDWQVLSAFKYTFLPFQVLMKYIAFLSFIRLIYASLFITWVPLDSKVLTWHWTNLRFPFWNSLEEQVGCKTASLLFFSLACFFISTKWITWKWSFRYAIIPTNSEGNSKTFQSLMSRKYH